MSLNRFSVFLFILALFCLFGLLIFDSDTTSIEGIAYLTHDNSDIFFIHGPGDREFLTEVLKTDEMDNWFYFGHWPKSGDHIRVTKFRLWLRWEGPTEISRILHIAYTKKLDTIEYVEPIEIGSNRGNSPIRICSICPRGPSEYYYDYDAWNRSSPPSMMKIFLFKVYTRKNSEGDWKETEMIACRTDQRDILMETLQSLYDFSSGNTCVVRLEAIREWGEEKAIDAFCGVNLE